MIHKIKSLTLKDIYIEDGQIIDKKVLTSKIDKVIV